MKFMISLLAIIFLEGYVVLSTELLAIRQVIPYVGSGTDTVSIIIAAVLMPLAFGYHAGGNFRMRKHPEGKLRSTRNKLLQNLAISTAVLTAGLSHIGLYAFFSSLYSIGLNDRVMLTSLYALIFIVYPVFLLGQTVPLITNFFPKQRLAQITGRVLFVSTLGSFMGAIFCTLVLMSTIGVHHSVSVTIGCLTVLFFLLSKHPNRWPVWVGVACLLLSLTFNSNWLLARFDIVSNNAYHTTRVIELDEQTRMLTLNNNHSSLFTEDPDKAMPYAFFVETNFLKPIRENGPKHSILVIGAGGFILGRYDDRNEYVYLDVNPELQKIAEEHFLKEPLGENKIFLPTEARAYLAKPEKQFDLIIIDAFYGYATIPEHLVTREFFQQVKDALKPGGIVIANLWGTGNFNDRLSVALDSTFRSVFPHANREIIGFYNAWAEKEELRNVMYTYFNRDFPQEIYTDDLNPSYYDRGKLVK